MTEYQDRQDISDVLIRYASGIDGRDWALFRTVFTADCDVDYGDIGHWRSVEEITDFMDRAHAMAGHTLHRVTNIAVTVEGDRAAARAYVDALILAQDNATGVQAAGFYDDELVRTDAGWRIARRRFTTVRVVPV